MNTASGKRLNKYISDSGFCSRREADKLIEQQQVTINGKPPELGSKVMPGDVVKVNGQPIGAVADNKSDRIYIAYNKPIGITCTTERQVRGNIVDAIAHRERIFPIGRLDKPSEGLIFLTNDGDIVNKILRAENAHDKEYVVRVDKPISERFVKRMAQGVPILGTVTKPCQVEATGRNSFKIVLTQGLNRQIRRMCEYLGYQVTSLKRTRIMSISLDTLKAGQWRYLTAKEMQQINQAVAGSRKTSERAEQKLGKEVKYQPKHNPDVAGNNQKPKSTNKARVKAEHSDQSTKGQSHRNSKPTRPANQKHRSNANSSDKKSRITGKLSLKK
ncbi:23S rRNA pseudouridine(2604) synthase RluF [Thalassotalea ponticola]|uniref:23S rRNA pseudouridine(2604) synthase RluF n=1 Tax=Thalassotalea ponticola TaxID=1523392 RepID=UPI0025B5C990|nr:23S rRNA pseudouridine(2604) synthase RluF [Thalassotalea ponticola]MDN3652401.1 23S rRNA pseudouridine(2604) synthase RluF [Thalassotalea ponticola]